MSEYFLIHDKKLYEKLENTKKLIPAELLIAGTLFPGMTFAWNLGEEFNAPCKNLNDMVSIFATLGAPTSEGNTIYFDEENNLCK